MPVAPLLAPGGVEMRVVSQAASFTWGSWSVTWPEGYEPPDPPAEDRELGWVADLGGAEVEPFGRCFVRADAQIDAKIGRSNVEDVLDAARYRTSGEVFLETEIPFENLAGQLPYRDFDVNSLVPTRVGGRILENQLVTKVEESEDEQGNRTASVYIGGQKFQDREALRTRNREIDRVIAQERLERGDEIGARLAASQEYEREQRDTLKRYVDRRDGEVTTSAEEDAAAKAGAALSTARTDATKKANSAQSQAESYARQQDLLKLREAKEYADEVVEDKATSEQLEEARQALTDYREQVAAKIGEQGTLTKQMESLSHDFEDKLGATGTVTEANAKHEKLLRGIVNGTDVAELDGTMFQQHQKLVNDMQVVFNARVSDNQQAFRDLFDTQAGWNKLQEAFNKRQTGINDVYDAMWEEQQQRDLLQEYLIEYNRIMAESRQAHDFEIEVVVKGSKIVSQKVVWDNSGAILWVSTFDGGRVDVELDDARAYGFLRATTNRSMKWFYAHAATNGYGFQFYFDWGKFSDEETSVTLNGTLFPQTLLPKDSYRLDKLAKEYRKKGLRI